MDKKTIKQIIESELISTITIKFHENGIAIDCKDVTSNRIIMGAVALLNKGLEEDGMQKFMNIMALANKVLEKKDNKDE